MNEQMRKEFEAYFINPYEAADESYWEDWQVAYKAGYQAALRAPVEQAPEYVEQLEQALRSVNAVAVERGDKFGVCDQIDNTGAPYQSQWLADLLKRSAAPSADRQAEAKAGWMPIETAPKDRDILLFCKGFGVVRGHWQDDRYSTKPRPYWTHDRESIWGKLQTRHDQPTNWMPLPAAPSAPGRTE